MPYDTDALIERLAVEADASYADFHRALIPGSGGTVLGVRTPILRQISQEILKAPGWPDFLEVSRAHPIYELRLLHGFVLGGARCPIEQKLRLIQAFLPCIDNWAVCDGLCSSFKPRPNEMAATYEYCQRCAMSDDVFTKRFGLVMLMSRFHEQPWLSGVIDVYRQFHHEAYYARMAAAWGLATLWIDAPEACLSILTEGLWDPFTHNKAIQKLCESRRISEADKALARSLRRTGGDLQ